MTDHLRRYANWSEYEPVLLPGTWRRTYDPRRHTYVMNYCQPIGLPPVTPDNIDKAMDFEVEPESENPGLAAMRAAKEQMKQGRLNRVAALLRERGPMTARQIAEATGFRRDWANKIASRYPDHICRVYQVGNRIYYGLVGESYKLPGMAVPVGGTGKR